MSDSEAAQIEMLAKLARKSYGEGWYGPGIEGSDVQAEDDFIAACTPEVILGFLELKAENAHLRDRSGGEDYWTEWQHAKDRAETLEASEERVRKLEEALQSVVIALAFGRDKPGLTDVLNVAEHEALKIAQAALSFEEIDNG